MRKTVWVAYALFSFSSAVLAQNVVDTKWRCTSPSAIHTLAVGDEPNHNFTILQGRCKAYANKPDFPEIEAIYTEFQEMRGATVNVHGRMNVTMKNSEIVYYRYEGSFPTDITKPFSQRWSLERGTGRYKSVKGNGICSGAVHADSTGDMKCIGTFSTGK